MTNVPVIPAVRTAASLLGELSIESGALIAVDGSELAPIAGTFVADVLADTGIALVLADAADGARIVVELAEEGLDEVAPAAGIRADRFDQEAVVDERYSLTVELEVVTVRSATPEGIHRGLTTLRQLIVAGLDTDGSSRLSGTRIVDGPRFGWRGLSLDVARTFHGVASVKRVIDMLSLHKLNVLHLHLTDDQGWRLEIDGWPLLTEIGAAGAVAERPGGFYTSADVADLVSYAAERFVTIVPEIDMPGHVTSIFRSYPELAPENPLALAAGGIPIPIGTLDPTRDITWRFVNDVFAATARLFATSAYIHIGGDEAFGMADEAHAAFVKRAATVVRGLDRRVVGWQEIARAELKGDEIVQYWMESAEMMAMFDGEVPNPVLDMIPAEMLPLFMDTMRKSFGDVPSALAQGNRLLVSPTSKAYLDRPYAEESSDPSQESVRARVGMRAYPAKTVRQAYEWDAVDETPGVADDSRIAGVEAAIWCETVEDQDDLDFLLLPRLPGVAERAWSSKSAQDAESAWSNYRERLAGQAGAWQRRGWKFFRTSLVDWDVAADAFEQVALSN